MQNSKNELSKSLSKTLNKNLFGLLKDLKNTNEIESFLSDFLTNDELKRYSKRLAIFYWLKKRRSHENIVTNLKVKKSEVKALENKLNSKGVKLGLKYLEAEEWANVWSEKINKFRLRHKKL